MDTQKLILNTVGDKAATYLSTKCSNKTLPHYLLFYWVKNNIKESFDGKIPGIEDSQLSIYRNDNGAYSGHLSIEDIDLEFADSSILDISATIAVCLNLDDQDFHGINRETSDLINSLILGHKQRFDTEVFKVKLFKTEACAILCPLCQSKMFKSNKFIGCLCFSSEGTKTTSQNNLMLMVTFDKKIWDIESFAVILQTLKRQ